MIAFTNPKCPKCGGLAETITEQRIVEYGIEFRDDGAFDYTGYSEDEYSESEVYTEDRCGQTWYTLNCRNGHPCESWQTTELFDDDEQQDLPADMDKEIQRNAEKARARFAAEHKAEIAQVAGALAPTVFRGLLAIEHRNIVQLVNIASDIVYEINQRGMQK